MPCTVSLSWSGSTLTATLGGDITFADSATFRRVVDDVLERRPATVDVDLSGVRMIDSAGLSLFVLLRDQASKVGARVSLLRPAPAVERVLEVVGFSKLFPIIR